ncbi:serine/threonine protein phosphatase [Adhaeribacter aerolatus]|uniref:Serine/threonine protein phosphatase n=1 Tax=Adhaeribacter aerolatus TaxID=670289 RepID=A0A512AY68_9BACT|nr:metallophosphoesterase family protein [Adhaeribacter aerolatus]GEO04467.1 serine/threonine protein phosphatase [Adhaeribacter aerolatus]
MSRYAISDIHGCNKTFRYLVQEVIKLKPQDELFLLGDYIDRGPDTKGVLDFILELQEQQYQVTTLMGNHEDMMLQALEGPEYLHHWFLNGGNQALDSFGLDDIRDIPEKYWRFLHQLDFYVELEDYLLVHAGFDFESPNPFQNEKAMLWIRDFKVIDTYTKGKTIIHGHTPIPVFEIEDAVADPTSEVIDIDGGCVFKMRMGHLTALNLDTRQLHAVRNMD